MTKQEQIEEMGKVMPEKIKDPLDNSRYIIFGKSLRREIARIYYNAGYRKLPEDSVVLSREEICELKYQSEEDFSKAYDLGSKETAEKIFKMLISKLDSNQFLSGKRIIMEVDVENLAKQFDVEIE